MKQKKHGQVCEGVPFWLITRDGKHLRVAVEKIFCFYRVKLMDYGLEKEDGPWAGGYAARIERELWEK